MSAEFQDRLAVVTGTRSGIGLALCAALLPRGVKANSASVVFVGSFLTRLCPSRPTLA